MKRSVKMNNMYILHNSKHGVAAGVLGSSKRQAWSQAREQIGLHTSTLRALGWRVRRVRVCS